MNFLPFMGMIVLIMVMVMRCMRFPCCVHRAVEAIHGTVCALVRMAFKLDSGMTNLVFLAQHGLKRS
jgi:hypothetical protein